MAEGQRMTVADVVAQTREGRLEDFVREAVVLVARELMEAEISEQVGAELDIGMLRAGGARFPSPNPRETSDRLERAGRPVATFQKRPL